VGVKNSVYVLPRSDEALEDYQWLRREIVAGGGEASVCEARFVEGLTDRELRATFVRASDAEYERLAREARRVHGALARRGPKPPARARAAAAAGRLRRRLGEAAARDFFGAPRRPAAERALAAIEDALRPRPARPAADGPAPGEVLGRTWVTRAGLRVDRIASAWLIRRFIDPEARFRFVAGADAGRPGELRFDMFEAEFTHEGDECTFEVLRRRFALRDPALRAVAEIVHEVDLKDGRFGRPEAAGLDRLVNGLTARHPGDEDRLREGAALFEALYASFGKAR
jgi:hypothetical protein